MITNSDTELGPASWWLLKNPASLQENLERDTKYGNWEYRITNSDGEAVPRVSLGPGDFTEVFLSVTMTNQVDAGNHTVFLRIVGTWTRITLIFRPPNDIRSRCIRSHPEIVQNPQQEFFPGNDYSITMIVKNEGNSPMTVLLEADVEASGWEVSSAVSLDPPIEIDQFDQATFTVEISVPNSANNGQSVRISITATSLIPSRASLTR